MQAHADHRQVATARHHADRHKTGVAAVVHRVAHLLPNQPVMEKFVHHNPLHALESMTFDEAVATMREKEKCVTLQTLPLTTLPFVSKNHLHLFWPVEAHACMHACI